MISLSGIPTYETDRLKLRAPALSDFETVVTYFASDRSTPVGGPLEREKVWSGFCYGAGQWAMRGYGFWYAERKEDGALIGRSGVYHPEDWPEPELSWTLFSGDYEGKGYAFEAAQAALQGAKDLNVPSLISSVKGVNPRSTALALRLGAQDEGDYETPYGTMRRFRHYGGRA